MEIALSHRLAIGEKGGVAPLINDLDWNPKPSQCKGKDAVAMIACVSSSGTNVYYFPKSTKKWTKMKIRGRPSREGETLKWHKNGGVLVTASNPKGDKPGTLSILSYDTNFMCFDATKVYECAVGSMISSVRWNHNGTRLAVALCPSSEILFFKFDRISGTLSQLGVTQCAEFPANTRIVLECHSKLDYMFACASDVTSIKVWSPAVRGCNTAAEDLTIGLMSEDVVKVESGQCGMEFNMHLEGLFTFERGMWRFWRFNEYGPHVLTCLFESTDEHSTLRRRFKSTMISFASSKMTNVAASGGSNDSMVVHQKAMKKTGAPMDWAKAASRNRNVCYGAATCLKFNPKDDLSMRVAMGGDSGYIHIWAVHKMNSSNVAVSVPNRHNEEAFYNKKWNKNLASTSSGDEDEAEDDEVEVEKATEDEDKDEAEDEAEDDDEDEAEDEAEDDDEDEAPEDDSKQGDRNVAATVLSADSQGQKRVREEGSQGQKNREKDAIRGGSGSASGTFQDITNDAKGIADRLEANDTVSPEETLALCRKILKYSSDIGHQ